jgi:hypothetical protein
MPFDEDYVCTLTENLREKGVRFEAGLTDAEVDRIEKEYTFNFPPDFRLFLEFGLPISEHFPNWRSGFMLRPIVAWESGVAIERGHKLTPISECFARPAEGICFDIEHSNFWTDSWGPRPADLSAAFQVARRQIARMPKLVPVYSHRYVAGEPLAAGNPVFSVHQTDIIYYGTDLADYFAREFGVSRPNWAANEAREIRFWSALALS